MGKIAQPGPYRLAEGERPTLAERRFLGYPDAYLGYVGYADFIGAEDTGECRPPKKGEWYLSGAVVEAYKATADYKGESFHIARLVRCVKCTYIKVTARIPKGGMQEYPEVVVPEHCPHIFGIRLRQR